jgi:hypothetical protein
MFIATLFPVAKIWNQPRIHQRTNGLENVVYIYIVGWIDIDTQSHYKEEILSFVSTQMEFKVIMSSEISQAQKDMNSLILWHLKQLISLKGVAQVKSACFANMKALVPPRTKKKKKAFLCLLQVAHACL